MSLQSLLPVADCLCKRQQYASLIWQFYTQRGLFGQREIMSTALGMTWDVPMLSLPVVLPWQGTIGLRFISCQSHAVLFCNTVLHHHS